MEPKIGKIFLLCGKIASGKSTLAKHLSEENSAILISQDEWLATLYPEEINSLEDYSRCFGRLAKIIGPHISEISKSGTAVVLDFPANTKKVRDWMKSIIQSAGCQHELHFVDTPEAVCLDRLKKRNESQQHEYQVTEEVFRQFSKHFTQPLEEEGFEIVIHTIHS